MKKRSAYRPRPILRDTMAWVLSGFKPLVGVKDENVKLRLKNHLALEAVIKGTATPQDVDVLIAASNMAMALRRGGKGIDWTQEIRAGADAVEALRDRARTGGRRICYGPELQAIRMMMEIHDAQLDDTTLLELDTAITRAKHQLLTGAAV